MRTILAGARALRRTPLAMAPLALEGVIGAVLVAFGALPRQGATAPVSAAFPFDVYFDVKQALSFSRSWLWFVAAIALSVLVRSLALAATLWIAEETRGSFPAAWARSLRLTAAAVPALLPAAGLFFTGVALRYAPFIWMGAIAGFLAAALLCKRAVRLDVGTGAPKGTGVPEMGTFLGYAYVITLLAWGMTVFAERSPSSSALLLVAAGPIHALFFVGWREHARAETYPGGGTLSLVVTLVVVVPLFAVAGYDRFIRDSEPVGDVDADGTLLLLGGADSTSETGALTTVDGRDLGFPRDAVLILSYRGMDEPYEGDDTRRDLRTIAEAVAGQIENAQAPRFLLGHSQASLILDRILAGDLPAPDAAVILGPSPPYPPPVHVPPPDKDGVGRPGGDVARLFSGLLERVGLQPFDIDAPASPTNLDDLVALNPSVRRVSVWALGDSVWLTGDWRRPTEVNFVALTDHVGITNNGRALRIAKNFFEREKQVDDESSWRGNFASVLRFAFEPWRPDR